MDFQWKPLVSLIFFKSFASFLAHAADFDRIDLQGGMIFLIQFFCATRYTLVLYGKKCLGDAAKVFNPEKYFGDFSFEIIPGAPPHLPGERELVNSSFTKLI